MPVKDHPSFNVQKNTITLSQDTKDALRSFVLENLPESAFSKRFAGRHEPIVPAEPIAKILTTAARNLISEIYAKQAESPMHKWLNKLYSHKKFKEMICCKKLLESFNKDCVEMSEITALNYDKWYAERKYRITGSKIYDLFTYSKNPSPDWKKRVLNILIRKILEPSTLNTGLNMKTKLVKHFPIFSILKLSK